MKTSKLILFSYIGLLAVAFLVFVIYLTSFDGDGRKNRHDKYVNVDVDLPNFEYIKVDNQEVYIHSADSNSAYVSYEKDSVQPDILWKVNADTLYILSSPEYRVLNLNLSKCVSLHIYANDARVNISGINADTIHFSGSKSRFNGFHECKFDVMYADLSHSNIHAYAGKFNYINLDLHSSELSMNKSLKRIQGHAVDNSKLRIGRVQKIGLEMDESSVFRCYP